MENPLPAPSDSTRPTARFLKGEVVRTATPEEERPNAAAEPRTVSLAAALRRARVESAEHSAGLADTRAAEIGRLEILSDALSPVLLQVPEDCDLFDATIAPGERPRLFIDQIGFIELDRDRRTYRFLQDTRHGRITLRESANVDDMVDAATDYIAHRLIEREKALAIDYASGGAARIVRAPDASDAARPAPPVKEDPAFRAFLFVVEVLGGGAFFALLAVIAGSVYRTYIAG